MKKFRQNTVYAKKHLILKSAFKLIPEYIFTPKDRNPFKLIEATTYGTKKSVGY